MRPGFIGMRWWLGLAFAGVAALTAVAVVALLSAHSEQAFRRYGKEFALGNSVAAAESLKANKTPEGVARHAMRIAEAQHLAIFVFDSKGRQISGPRSFGLQWDEVTGGHDALRTALSGYRYIHGRRDGSSYTIGLPIHRGAGAALVAYSLRPELRQQLGIVRTEYLQSALIAFGVGAALGLLIAGLTARRLARIARAASDIGAGNFGVEVTSNFPDEVGSLALSIEQMQTQLKDLFRALEGDRDRLERLLDRLNEGVLLVDRELKIEFANDRAHELLGVGDSLEALGTSHSPTTAAIRSIAVDLFSIGIPGHLRVVTDDKTFLISGIPPSEGSDSAIVVVLDETEREHNERVQREFATNAAHELRTPLASIVTAVEMLRTGAKDDRSARDAFLDVIAREAGRLTRLTRALLVPRASRVARRAARLAQVELRPLLEQIAASLQARDGVGISVDCQPALAFATDTDLLDRPCRALQRTRSRTPTTAVSAYVARDRTARS